MPHRIDLNADVGEIPPEWHRTAEVLKSRPGLTLTEDLPDLRVGEADRTVQIRLDLPDEPIEITLANRNEPGCAMRGSDRALEHA